LNQEAHNWIIQKGVCIKKSILIATGRFHFCIFRVL